MFLKTAWAIFPNILRELNILSVHLKKLFEWLDQPLKEISSCFVLCIQVLDMQGCHLDYKLTDIFN